MTDNTHINPVQENVQNVQLPEALDNNIKDKLMAAGVVGASGAAVYGTYNLMDNNNSQTVLLTESDNEESKVADQYENDCDETLTNEVTYLEEIILPAESNSISFADAFKNARKTLGPNTSFEWNGSSFSTNYQEIGVVTEIQNEEIKEEISPREILDETVKLKNIEFGKLEPKKPEVEMPKVKKEDLPDLFDQNTAKSSPTQEINELRFGKLDTNNDGKWDTIVIDRNNDGKVDIMAIDEDNDGKFDIFMINDNNDKTLDRMITDINHNGIDRNDISESISYEIDMNDYDQVNENDPGFDQFDILGGLL